MVDMVVGTNIKHMQSAKRERDRASQSVKNEIPGVFLAVNNAALLTYSYRRSPSAILR